MQKQYTTPSVSAELIEVATSIIHILAFPLHKHTESIWNKWEVDSAGESYCLRSYVIACVYVPAYTAITTYCYCVNDYAE